MKYNVAVVGSRDFNNKKLLEDVLSKHNIKLLISGGARGADILAEEWADTNNIPKQIFIPDWYKNGKYDRAAGFVRNKKIVDAADYVIAFWDMISNGTKDSINYAKKTNKHVVIIDYLQYNENQSIF